MRYVKNEVKMVVSETSIIITRCPQEETRKKKLLIKIF